LRFGFWWVFQIGPQVDGPKYGIEDVQDRVQLQLVDFTSRNHTSVDKDTGEIVTFLRIQIT
jgi:hypothetical protein